MDRRRYSVESESTTASPIIYSSPSIGKKTVSEESMAIDKFQARYDNLANLHQQQQQQTGNSRLSEPEVSVVEACYQSHKTYVYVCRCLANLYFAQTDATGQAEAWKLTRTGVPVLLFDKGETKARSRRMVQIILAEKGTGFALWRDVIDNLSAYRCPDPATPTFQTMYLSYDHRRMVGLSFDSESAASQFWNQIEELTSDPLNISLSAPKGSRKSVKNQRKSLPPAALPKKSEISAPCCFQHVASVDLQDKEKLYSLAAFVRPDPHIDEIAQL